MESDEDISTFLCDTCCPVGHQYTLVAISITKRLLNEEIPASYRLQFLEYLDKWAADTAWLTQEIIANIEPVCDRGYEIVREAQKLGTHKAFGVYAQHVKTFAKLNPSLIAALKSSPTYQARRRS